MSIALNPTPLPRIAAGLFLFLILAFPASGASVELAWRRTLDIPAGLGTALCLDTRGDVCVTGTIDPEPVVQPTRRLVTAKYTSDGTLKWFRTFGADDHHYQPSEIATDTEGRVWIASLEVKTFSDIGQRSGNQGLVLHYDADGTLLWTNRFGEDSHHAPKLVLDPDGNAYAAIDTKDPVLSDVGSPHRLRVTKISPSGQILWSHIATRTYDLKRVHDLMLDAGGRVRILAQPTSDDGSLPPFVATYLTDGTVPEPGAWTVWEYLGADSLAGRWTSEGSMVLLASSSLHTNDRSRGGVQISAFSATGARRFHSTAFLAPNSHLIPSMVQTDSRGGTLVLGTARTQPETLPSTDDLVVMRWDVNGQWNWTARYNGAASRNYRATGMALDAEGSAYISAIAERTESQGVAFVVFKLSPDGTQLWESSTAEGGALAVAAAPSGNVFAAGYMNRIDTPTSAPQFALAKFIQPSGSQPLNVAVTPPEHQVIQGEPVIWRSEVTGAQPLAYQWRHDGQPLPQQTNATLSLPAATIHDRGDYSVVVTHAAGKAVSPEARLEVRLFPNIQSTTPAVRVTVGRSTVLEVQAIGDEPLNYQWFRATTPIPSATHRFLQIETLTPDLAGSYRVVVTNAIGRAEASIQVDVVPIGPLDVWTWRHPLPQGNDLRAAAYGLNQFVVVGNAGTLLSTPDLIHWTHHSREEFGDLIDIAWADDRFLAVGADGQIITSTNGSDWNVTPVPASAPLSAVAHGNDATVLVGRNFLLSTNGRDWQTLPVPVGSGRLSDVTFGGGRFFAALDDATADVLISTNGSEWTRLAADSTSILAGAGNWVSLHHDGHSLIALSKRGTPYLSVDGSRWTANDFPTDWIFRDLNGPAENLVAVGRIRPFTSDAIAARIFNSTQGSGWVTNQLSLGNNLHHVVHVHDRFLALGDDGHLLHSTNGMDWILVTPSSDDNLKGAARGADRCVAVGDNGLVLVSSAGEPWRRSAKARDREDFSRVAYGDGRFIAATEDGSLWVSDDGDQWEETWVDHSLSLKAILRSRNVFVAVGSSGTILTSPNGRQWTSRPLGIPSTLLDLAESPERLIAVTWGSVGFSADGLSWVHVPVDDAFEVSHVAFGQGLFVATSPRGLHWISTNGLDWERGNTMPGPALDTVHFAAHRFVAAGDSGTVFSSTDGRVWQEHFTGSGNRLRSFLSTPRGTLIGLGNNGALLESAPLLPSLSILRATNLTSQLQVSAWPGTYRLQATDEFPAGDWRDLHSIIITNASTPANYPDRERASSRFYRVVY